VAVPPSAYITASPVLQNATIPSGGSTSAYVGVLYEGQPYTRTYSIEEFLTSASPSFYIIGANDKITDALPLSSIYAGRILLNDASGNPALKPFRVTYQCYGNADSKDIITTASTEFLTEGNINILYRSNG
jgi:hypothetical protein